jgi:predicted transcriptional regulator of viral defense system
MKYDNFFKKYKHLPIIESVMLFADNPEPESLKVQLSRWVKAGKLIQLKRGVYVFSETYNHVNVSLPYAANILKKPSYISLEKALEMHTLIPEAVKVYTSVTPMRSARFVNPLGVFNYRHIHKQLFWGYDSVAENHQVGFVASPEKALLDLFYVKRLKVTGPFLKGLRLQNMENINCDKLTQFSRRFNKPYMTRYAGLLIEHIECQKKQERSL